MAVRCPKCSRPNSPQAKKCIYCGAELPTPAPAQKPSAEKPLPKKPAKKEKKPSGYEQFYLIISPLEASLSLEQKKKLARALGWDEYSVQVRFQSRYPWVLKIFDDARSAQALASTLQALDVDAYLLKKTGLRKLGNKLLARYGKLEAEGILFTLENREEKLARFDEMMVLVRGKVPLDRELLAKFLPADSEQLLKVSGSRFEQIISWRKRRKERKNISSGRKGMRVNFLIFDLYLKDLTALRILETEFDYTGIIKEEITSQTLKMEKFLSLVKEKAPALVVDDSFSRAGYFYPSQKREELGMAGLLIPESPTDPLKEFNDYSSRIFLHYLRKARLKD